MKKEKLFFLLTDKDRLARILCLLISIETVLAVWNFIATPIVSDFRVFLSGANQASYINKNLIIGSYKQWELKGCLNRLLIYMVYRIAMLVTEYPSYCFGVVCSIVYLIIVFSIIALSVNLIFDTSNGYKKIIYTELVFLSLVMTWVECHVQAEMSGTAVLILAFALYYNTAKEGSGGLKKNVAKLLSAGVLIGAVFYIKSIMLLMSVSVVAGIGLLLSKKKDYSFKRLCIVVLGAIIEIIFNAGLLSVINPSEFGDMLNASLFQRPFWASSLTVLSAIKSVITHFNQYMNLIPILNIGVVCLVLNIVCYIRTKNLLKLFYDIIMWLMPFSFVFISSQYFVYHYLVFVFPSIIEVIVLFKRKTRLGVTIVCLLFFAVCMRYQTEMGYFSRNIQSYIMVDKETYTHNKEFFNLADIDREAVCMYLDDGIGSYYLGNESYLKYYFPLPLQRLSDTMDAGIRTETLEKAMGYDGKYILVYDNWFFALGYNDDLRKKIDLEYKYIGSFKRYAPPSFISDDMGTQEYDLYERR